jgi:hypothetical protein
MGQQKDHGQVTEYTLAFCDRQLGGEKMDQEISNW